MNYHNKGALGDEYQGHGGGEEVKGGKGKQRKAVWDESDLDPLGDG